MTWNWDAVVAVWPSLLSGLRLTVEATLGGSALAIVLGLVIAVIRIVRVPILWRIVLIATEIIRGTPLLVQLYFAYFVLPSYGLTFSPLLTGILVLGVYNACYMSEAYRAAVLTVPHEQVEAGVALNLSPGRRWRSIILPQAVPIAIPALGNYVIAMFKESALLSVITVPELLHNAQSFGESTYRFIEPLTSAAVLYFAVSLVASTLVRWSERRASYVRA